MLQDKLINIKHTKKFQSTKLHAVYFMYDDQDNIVYIGKSLNGRLAQRIQAHYNATEFFKHLSYISISLFENAGDCNIYECYYIAKYLPKHNKDKPSEASTLNLPEVERDLYYSSIRNLWKPII